MFKCKYCGKEFEKKQQLGGHITCCKYNENRSHNHPIPKHIYTFNCLKCNKEFKLELTEKQYSSGKYKKFCSRSCANSRVISNDTKKKISNSLIKNTESHNKCDNLQNSKLLKSNNVFNESKKSKYIKRICRVCNKEYTLNKDEFAYSTPNVCSTECKVYMKKHRKEFLSEETIRKLSLAGLKSCSIQAENRRSKNEIYFCDLCEKYFNNVSHNESIFNGWDADVIIEDIKFAILWNGKWHYEKIKKEHSVKHVQNRDNIKIKEITKCGYIPYIIKDMGKYNKTFVDEQFNIFIEFLKNNNYIVG